jgi:hypothetical protein
MKVFPPLLKELLEDDSILKVGVGVRGDGWNVQRDYNVAVKCVFDLNMITRGSLEDIACRVIPGKQTWKNIRITTSNWERTELTDEQLAYAARDAFAGHDAFYAAFAKYGTPGNGKTPLQWATQVASQQRNSFRIK